MKGFENLSNANKSTRANLVLRVSPLLFPWREWKKRERVGTRLYKVVIVLFLSFFLKSLTVFIRSINDDIL